MSHARKLRDGEPVKPRSGAHASASVAPAAMRSQLAFMTGIANMATRCINASPAEIAAEIMDALRMIGEFFGADRSYILSFCDDERSMQYAYEWGTTGIVSVMAPLKGIPLSRYPWCVKTLKEAGMLNIAQLSQLPESAWAERALLQAVGVRSFVAVPLSTGGVLSGCLGLSALQSEHRWDGATIALLRQATDVFAKALQRARTQQRLATQYTVARVLAESVTLGEAIPKLLQSVCEGVGAELGDFWRVEPTTNRLLWGGTWHAPGLDAAAVEGIGLNVPLPPGTGLPGRVWATGEPECRSQVVPTALLDAAPAERPGYLGAFAFPVCSGARVTGVMSFYSRSVLACDNDLLEMLHALGSQIGNFTARKRAEEQARQLTVELEQRVSERTSELAAANKELEAFSYSVSHDLRAPLRSIAGFSQALVDEHARYLNESGQDCVRRVHTASQRMTQLIDDLLHLSRVTRGGMRRERIDLSALAVDIAADLQKAQPARRVAFMIADGLLAYADPRLVRIALENLFGNAWKYTFRHAQARIEFGAIDRHGEAVYYVRDDGAGFNMAYAEKLFVPFQRLHGASEFDGTGIGLATVQRIIHRHGGVIWAHAAIEEGATLFFTLGARNRG